MSKSNWKQIRDAYEHSDISMKDIAKKYHVKYGTLRVHKNRYKWRRNSQSNSSHYVTDKRNSVTKYVTPKIHPDLLDNDKLSEKQRAFACYYIKYFGDAYQAAIKAGYSEKTAKNARKNIVENRGLRNAIHAQFRQVVDSNLGCHASFDDVLANQLNIGAGVRQRRRYQKIDNRDPSQSTDVTLIGSPGIRDQVNAGKTLIQFQHQTDLNRAQIGKINADTELTKSKLPNNKDNKIRKPIFLDEVIKHHQMNEKRYKKDRNS